MGILLSCHNLSKSYSSRPLFENLSFGLFEGERTGLIGPNGAGKSTLLKILAGLETPDSGHLSVRKGLKVRYLAQTDVFHGSGKGLSVRDELVASLAGLGLEDYEIDIRVDEGIETAGFNPDQRVDSLSGGWKKRLAILAQVLQEPDLLFLDEPTNHLDLEGVVWLETFLQSLRFSFLVITHDRRFLDTVCNRVIEVNKRYREGFFSSQGNYGDFLESREKLFAAQAAREETMKNTVRRELEWLRRGPKARTTKQKARIDRAGELVSELGELQYRNAQDKTARIDFTASDRRSKKLIQLKGATKAMGGRTLFGPLDLMLCAGDKLGLLGGNGSGKSTFLKMLAGALAPDAGEVWRADDLRVVVFDQHREQLDPAVTLKKALCENGEMVQYKGSSLHVAGWAERFLFSKDQLMLPVGRLSGGEQARVLIARLMLRPADILLLDEPTNDLDINSLEVLETAMADFAGVLVLVTHDRYLLDRVSDSLLALDGRGNARAYADLDQWEAAQGAPPEPERAAPAPAASAAKPVLSAKESKELSKLEARIAEMEEKRAFAKAALEDPAVASNASELFARQAALEAVDRDTAALMARWEELEARRTGSARG